MAGVIEIAGAILARSSERVEVAAQNLTNMTTPGYKALRWLPFEISENGTEANNKGGSQNASIDFSPGQLQNTGNAFDLAISGAGFFVVHSDSQTFYTRDGQFVRGADGRIETSSGLALQSASGGDINVTQNNPQILSDGTVLISGQPVARVATVDFADQSVLKPEGAGLYSAPDEAATDANAQIRQGMLETSNVSTAGEMITIMSALRSAESGQKVAQVYDDLMGRALDAFGQS